MQKKDNIFTLIYKDNGCGISANIKKKIFDPFFTTNKEDGTGLGMHIVYNLINQNLKGSISLSSKENNGVTFKIEIPLEIQSPIS